MQETDKIAEKCREADVKVIYEDGVQQVFLNGENVNGKIRTEEIGKMASTGAAVPGCPGVADKSAAESGRKQMMSSWTDGISEPVSFRKLP